MDISINFIGTKLSKSLYILRETKKLLPTNCHKTLYYTTYAIEMWETATKELLNKLTKTQCGLVHKI